ADAHYRPLHIVRQRVHDPLDSERAGRRRLLELPSGLHRNRTPSRERQPDRALRAPTAEGGEPVTVILEEPIQTFLGEAEERGTIEESALEAFAAEHDLDEDELTALKAELEAREVDVATPMREPAESQELSGSTDAL